MIQILKLERSYALCVKPVGVLSEEPGMPALLREQLGGEWYCVHRLDKAVGGVMVYARTRKAAAALSAAVAEREMKKEYLAVCQGAPEPPAGTMEDLLFKDSGKNKAFVVKRERKGVKPARLSYETLAAGKDSALVHVTLDTGRFHQIRVQFASRKHPLLGDRRYGGPTAQQLGLWSWRLTIPDPDTGKPVTACALPEGEPWSAFAEKMNLME